MHLGIMVSIDQEVYPIAWFTTPIQLQVGVKTLMVKPLQVPF